MRKLRIMFVLCAFYSIPLKAQDYPMAEVYGGYQLLLDEDTFLTDSGSGTQLNGFTAAGEFNVKSYLGFVGELGYGFTAFNDRNQVTLLTGPRFSHRGGKVRGFGHILFGLSHDASTDTLDPTHRISTNNFALVVGGGMDITLGNRISIRPFQLDAMSTKHQLATGHEHQHLELRYTGGISVKLGAVSR